VDEHETVAVPLVLKLVDEIGPQFSPVGAVSVKDTIPVSPLSNAIVIVDLPDAPTFNADGEVATIEKSGGVP
jgi:hypothetical protein